MIAVAICLLVPWFPVLMYRCFPRRPPLPPAAGQLERLNVELQRPDFPGAEEALVDDHQPRTDIGRRPQGSQALPRRTAAQPPHENAPQGSTVAEVTGAATKAAASPRLTVPSYRWLNLLFIPVFIVTMLALGAAWALLFQYLGEERARTFEPAVFLFKPFAYGVIFAIPALILGIFSTIPLLVLLSYFLLGRRRFLEFLFWDEGRLSHRGRQPEGIIHILSCLALIVGILSAIYVCLAMNWYGRFTEDAIAIKRFFAFGEEVHPYGSVEQIVLTSHRRAGKEIIAGEDLGLRFDDGRTWSTGETFVMPRDPPERDRLLDLLRRKTGRPIIRTRLLKDFPGY